MDADVVSQFEQTARGITTSCRRVPVAEANEALADLVEPPAVGVPLPVEGVDLPEDVTVEPGPADLRAARTGVTPAGLGIADYGTVTVTSTAAGDELVSLYADRHVAVLRAADVVADMPAAFERLAGAVAAGEQTHVLTTGPSSTADMGTLVQGVHGPEEVHVVVVEP